jgi:hypothetical protein
MPEPGVDALETEEAEINPKDTTAAAVIRERSRKRAIASPRGLKPRILTPAFRVNV